MEIFQELFLTVAVSLFVSFVLAKLLSVVSACDAEYKTVLKTETVTFEQRDDNGKGLAGCGFEDERRVRFIEEAVVVDECEDEELEVEEMEVCELPLAREMEDDNGDREVGVVELGERESVGGGDVAEKVVEMEVSSEIEVIEVEADQLLDEIPDRIELVKDGVSVANGERGIGALEGEGNTGKESDDEVKINEERCGGSGGEEEERLFDEGEWEWEGIERSELEKCFGAAVAFVSSKDNADRISVLDNDVKMELCGLHKVAIEGPCFEPQPMALKVSARAKWNAWKQLENMGPEVAMEQYIALLSRSIPSWMGNDTSEFKTTQASVA